MAWIGQHGRLRWVRPARLAAACLVLFWAVGQFQHQRPVIRENPDAPIAALLSNSQQPGLLAATDVLGRLGYYAGNVRILDMAGLTDEYIARHGRPSPPFGRSDFDYVMSQGPHFIMNNVAAAWPKRLLRGDFTDGYWWVDYPPWTRGGPARSWPRFVFIRRDTILAEEVRSWFPGAAFRSPRAVDASAPRRPRPAARVWPVQEGG